MKLVQKLSIATLGWKRGDIETALQDIPRSGEILLCRVAGIVTGVKPYVDQNQEINYGMKGQFKGMSSKDNFADASVSGVCYLPSGIQAMIEGELAKAQDEGAGGSKGATITFAMDVYAFNDSNKAGYSFRGENLLVNDAGGNDPLDLLLGKAAELAALPAPDKASNEKKGK